MKLWIAAIALAVCAAQTPKQFLQVALLKPIKANSAKVGDPVKAKAINSVTFPGGISISQGATLLGQVRAADPKSLSISFDEVEESGKQTPLSLSIRAAMMPGGPQNNVNGVAAETGSVIGMPGVTLKVDDSPQHAGRFQTTGKDLQLKSGLQLMLAVPE